MKKHFTFTVVSLAILCILNTMILADNQDGKILNFLDQQSRLFAKVAKTIRPAVVHISVEKNITMRDDPMHKFFGDEFFNRFFRDRLPKRKREYKQRALGSGVIIDKKGYILTNNHVVKEADKIQVHLSDKRQFKAKVVGTDAKTDIAVIKIEGENLPTAPLGNSEKLVVGQWVLAVGNPFGLNQTVTAGIISAKGRSNVGVADYEDFIQTDAAINPGNSGGPLVNLKGEVIGVNTAIASRSGGNIGIGFAVPINMAKKIMNQLIKSGKVQRGWLGVRIQNMDQRLAESFGLKKVKGALVAEVMENSPAQKGGMLQGDVILEFDGVAVDGVNKLRNVVATTDIGKEVTVKISRDDKIKYLKIKIGNLENAKWGNVGGEGYSLLGMSLSEVTPELVKKFRLPVDSGVVITNIKEDSPALRYNMKPGTIIVKINRTRIHNLEDVRKAIKNARHRILLLVRTRAGHSFLVLPLNK